MSMHEHEDATTKKRAAIPSATPPRRERDPIPHRQIWGGAAALVAAMLLIVLFPQVLHPSDGTTTTAIKHPTAVPTVAPTATPMPLTPAQAWGSTAIAHYALTLPDGTSFIPSDITPNGTTLVGFSLPPTAYFIETLTLPSMNVRQLYRMPIDAAEPILQTDGTYVAMVGGFKASATPGPIHQLDGFFNMQSHSYNILYDTNMLQYNPLTIAVDRGQFFWNPTKTPSQLNDMDMATTNINLVQPPNAAFAFDTTPAIQVVWPHLLYGASDHTMHSYNLQTQHDVALSTIPIAGKPQLVGNSVVWAQPDPASGGTAIETVANVDQANPTAQAITVLRSVSQIKQLAATPRLIAWNDGTTFAAYDRQKQIIVTLHAQSATPLPIATLATHGNMLWYQADENGQPGIDVINTATLAP